MPSRLEWCPAPGPTVLLDWVEAVMTMPELVGYSPSFGCHCTGPVGLTAPVLDELYPVIRPMTRDGWRTA